MKYFKESKVDKGYGKEGIVLGEVFSISKEDNKFVILEECDGFYRRNLSKEEAIELFEEAIEWIQNQ